MEVITPIAQQDELAEAKQLIAELDLSAVMERLIKVEHWTEAQAAEGCKQYRRYLFLRKKYPQFDLPPSEDIDEVWHAHILHTRDYIEFCREVFGKYLHHEPHISHVAGNLGLLKDAFAYTQQLYNAEFEKSIFRIVGKSKLCVKFIKWRNRFVSYVLNIES